VYVLGVSLLGSFFRFASLSGKRHAFTTTLYSVAHHTKQRTDVHTDESA
jgi:hypothetical protein